MVWKSDQGRKIPRAPQNGGPELFADAMDSENWMSFERAQDYVEKVNSLTGVTYSLQSDDGLTLMDYDDVRDPETGRVLPIVKDHIERVGGYAQISTSGTGVHLIVDGSLPEHMKSLVIDLDGGEHAELEIYDGKRFIAMTGDVLECSDPAIRDGQPLLDDLADKYGDDAATKGGKGVEDWEPTSSREEIESKDTTSNIEDIFDAIKHTAVNDIRLKSDRTEGEPGGRMSFDPSWEQSDSGTRLGYEDGAWIYRKGNVGLDALQVVALEERIIFSTSEYPSGGDFWDAVEALRDRGAPIPELVEGEEDDSEALGILPIARLGHLSHEDRQRYAKKRGIDWPDVEGVRERLREEIMAGVERGDTAVKSSPTGSGKTHAVATEPWRMHPDVTGDQPIVHAHKTREARDQGREMSDDADVDAYTLKGRTELCPVAAGEHDPENAEDGLGLTIDGVPISDWIDHRCERQGIPFSVVHGWAESEINGQLPCEEDGTQCAAKGQFDGVPRDDNGQPSHDVIHTTHQFLQVPSLRMHTNVFVDEKPSFGVELDPEEVRQSVNAYLGYIDAPVENFNELVYAAEHGDPPGVEKGEKVEGVIFKERKNTFQDQMDNALNGYNDTEECPECEGSGEIDPEQESITDEPARCPECSGRGEVTVRRGKPPLTWYRNNPQAHAMAPAFARAIWDAEETAGNRKHHRVPFRPPRFDSGANDEAGWNRVFVDVVLDDNWEVIQAESVPDFSLTEAVIGLDAHPDPQDPIWQANVHPDMETDFVLPTQERTLYRRYERGLFTVQVGDGIQPVASGEWLSEGQGDKIKAMIKQLREKHGDKFDSAITSIKAKPFVRKAMEDAGIEDPDIMHFGNEESRNDFAGKEVGIVIGSIDPGDAHVVNTLARLGLDADPVYKECPTCDGTREIRDADGESDMCQTCNGTGKVRERGRTFEGPDADMADAVLRGIREHHVAQSAGRWARDADDPDDHATVYIMTEATPTGFIDAKTEGVTWTTSEEQRERLEYVRESPDGVTAKGVAAETGCSKQAAWRTLRKAYREGLLEKTPGSGPYGADVYSPDEALSPNGAVDLDGSSDGPLRDGYEDTITWTVTIEALPHCAYSDYTEEAADWEYQSTFGWFERGVEPPS